MVSQLRFLPRTFVALGAFLVGIAWIVPLGVAADSPPGRAAPHSSRGSTSEEVMIQRVEELARRANEGHDPRGDIVDPARSLLVEDGDSRNPGVGAAGSAHADAPTSPPSFGGAPDSAGSSSAPSAPSGTSGDISGALSESFQGTLPRFGDDLFQTSPETYAPATFGALGPDYRLGPGDEVVVDVWGDVVFRVDQTLDRSGNLLLPDAGQVHLQGLNLEQAKERLRTRYSSTISGFSKSPATAFLDVSLARLKPVKVIVVGEARRPGSYDLSAASTILHAVVLAGGPNGHGSMRGIQLIRGDRVVATLDVAEYLRSGLRPGDARLENDDTIYIPRSGPQVAARGEIHRPAIYEMKPGETLFDLITMAGGTTARTALDRAHVIRVLADGESNRPAEHEIVVDVPLGPSWEGAREFLLRDLDDVTFFQTQGERRNYVSLLGNVWRPGTYQLRPGMRISDLIAAADSLRDDTFSERAILLRTHPDKTKETMTFDLRRALQQDPTQDLELRSWDEITVFSIWDLQDPESVSIHGAVRKPGRYDLTEKMTVGDLLLRAGGFLEYAYPDEVEVSRVYPGARDSSRFAQTFRVEVGRDFPRAAELPGFILHNHDQVFVRKQPSWELQQNVAVEGEVRFPGSYTILRPDERLAEVIARAGGLTPTAFLEGFQLIRAEDGVGRISIDLERALSNRNSQDNLILVEGDTLRIPKRPMTVRVSGAVGLPTSLVYEDGAGIGHYVGNAGGYLDTAKKSEAKVIYSTGRAAKVKRLWFDPKPEPGSVIVVPPKTPQEGVDWGETIKDVTAILASLATTYLVIDRISD